jgi:hypothetical protein
MSNYTGDIRPDPWIVCAALRTQYGEVVCAPRHFDRIMHTFIKTIFGKIGGEWKQAEQGFVDQYGAFYTREAAYDIAAKNGQIRRPEGGTPGVLYSENLY